MTSFSKENWKIIQHWAKHNIEMGKGNSDKFIDIFTWILLISAVIGIVILVVWNLLIH